MGHSLDQLFESLVSEIPAQPLHHSNLDVLATNAHDFRWRHALALPIRQNESDSCFSESPDFWLEGRSIVRRECDSSH